MKDFLCEKFLLSNETSMALYHDCAAKLPIIDYHCHIDPKEIAQDRHYENITQAWLYADHYKWRAMRTAGIGERFITGNATDYEKFTMWTKTLPLAIGNPLYHWTHLELKRFFGYGGVLNEHTVREVWELCNKKLESLGVRAMIEQANVSVVCTTDDLADSLEWHKTIAKDPAFNVKVLPALRPDKAVNIESEGFCGYIGKLSGVAGIRIARMDDLFAALTLRLDHFMAHGCVCADHGLDAIPYAPAEKAAVESVFQKRLAGEACSAGEAEMYKFTVLEFLAGEYVKRNWVMELHYGANRNINARLSGRLGPDTGLDCISGVNCGLATASFLNHLHERNKLPKTIIFSLNPNDDAIISSIAGGFQAEGICGKIQQGSAWWFNDTRNGMLAQMASYANLSLLGGFVGMLTDSRSFLSYTRHEYFRRILCDFIGRWVENGEYPRDNAALTSIIEGICYKNAKAYFGF